MIAGVPTRNDDKNNTNSHCLSFEVDVPGVKIHALKVEVDADKLSISGERNRRGEPNSSPFDRAFALDTKRVDTNKLEAFLEDGVLAVRVPAKTPVAARNIPVKTSHVTRQEDNISFDRVEQEDTGSNSLEKEYHDKHDNADLTSGEKVEVRTNGRQNDQKTKI